MLRELKDAGLGTYLETNGTLPEALTAAVEFADTVAMDIKLPSAAGGPELWAVHAKFLEIARRSDVFVKAVVSRATSQDEIRRCAELVSGIDRQIPLVIQPASGCAFADGFLLGLLDAALESLADVRVIPQCHKVLGLP